MTPLERELLAACRVAHEVCTDPEPDLATLADYLAISIKHAESRSKGRLALFHGKPLALEPGRIFSCP